MSKHFNDPTLQMLGNLLKFTQLLISRAGVIISFMYEFDWATQGALIICETLFWMFLDEINI